MKAAVLKFIRKLVGVEFRQNADFFSTQLSKVHEYYFKGRALHRKLHFKTNNEVDDNGNYSGAKIWKRSSRRSSIPRWWNCSKKRLKRGKLCEEWRSARASHNTLRLIVHYSTHTLIINDDNDRNNDDIKIGPKINNENWNLAKMGPKNAKFMK